MKPITKLLVTFSVLGAAAGGFFAWQQCRRAADLETQLQEARHDLTARVGTEVDVEAEITRLESENEELRRASEVREARLSELRGQLAEVREEPDPKSSPKPTPEADPPSPAGRADTLAESRFLASLESYLEDVEFLALEDLSEKERSLFAPYADRMVMVGGDDDHVGLFGLQSGSKALSDIPEELEPWVDAYAAVSFHHRAEETRVIDDLIARGQAPRFSSKVEAHRFQTDQRAAYSAAHGRPHPGWIYRPDRGEIILVERDTLASNRDLADLQDARNRILTRLGDGERDGRGFMEKWVPRTPDPGSGSASDSD